MLPEEEDLDFGSDSEDEETEEEIDDFLIKPMRRLIINVSALQKYMLETTVCKFCRESQTIFEHKSQKHGLGTKLTFQCARGGGALGFQSDRTCGPKIGIQNGTLTVQRKNLKNILLQCNKVLKSNPYSANIICIFCHIFTWIKIK